MPTSIKSNNSNPRPLIANLLLPSFAQILLDLLIAGLLLTLLNVRSIWAYLNNTVLGYHQKNLPTLFGQEPTWLHHSLQILVNDRVPQIVFWLLLGCVIYLMIWFAKNSMVNIRNDIVASKFVRPLSRKGYWSPILLEKLFLFFNLVILLAYAFAAYRLIPVLARLCRSAFSNFQPVSGSLQVVESLVATTLLIQFFLLLTHITINTWSTINNGL